MGVGSWPRPGWLLRALHDYLERRLDEASFQQTADDAVRLAVAAQERAGVDVVTDGEQRRDSYASFVGSRLDNCQLIPLTDLLPYVDDPHKFEEELRALDVPAGKVRHPAVLGPLLRSRPLAGPPPAPAGAPDSGRWIDVNLLLQVATAYEGSTPVRSALISTGRPGWETPVGTWKVLRRVPKETMDGSTLIGQGPSGRGASYRVENVRWTQYFTPDGAAIHENYWRNPATFGIPGSF